MRISDQLRSEEAWEMKRELGGGRDWPHCHERGVVEIADLRALPTPTQHPLELGDPGSLSMKSLCPGAQRAAI